MPSAASKTPSERNKRRGCLLVLPILDPFTPGQPMIVFRFAHTPAQTLRRAARALSAPPITKDSILQHKDRNDPDHASEADERLLGLGLLVGRLSLIEMLLLNPTISTDTPNCLRDVYRS